MFRTWVGAADTAEELARKLEAHLNEFADEVISVSYDVGDQHRALAVYRPVETTSELAEAAVAEAEQVVEEVVIVQAVGSRIEP